MRFRSFCGWQRTIPALGGILLGNRAIQMVRFAVHCQTQLGRVRECLQDGVHVTRVAQVGNSRGDLALLQLKRIRHGHARIRIHGRTCTCTCTTKGRSRGGSSFDRFGGIRRHFGADLNESSRQRAPRWGQWQERWKCVQDATKAVNDTYSSLLVKPRLDRERCLVIVRYEPNLLYSLV